MADLSRERIPVSTVLIEPDQGYLRLVEDFAEVTGGVFYRVQDIEKLPQLFIRLGRQARQTPQRQTKIVADPDSSIIRGIREIPSLEFFSITQPKDGASVPLSIDRPDHPVPLVAAWQYGLGRSAIFAADPDSLAAIGWIHWDRYAQFWSQLLSWTMRQGQAGAFDLKVEETRNGDLSIEVESSVAVKAEDLVARVTGSLGTAFDVVLTQVGDALYTGKGPALRAGKYRVDLIRHIGKVEQVLAAEPFAVTAIRPADDDELSISKRRLSCGFAFSPPPAYFGVDSCLTVLACWLVLRIGGNMKTFRAEDIKRNDPVWVWDGSWLPAVIADVVLEPERNFAIVWLENGCSAPVPWPDIEPRDPDKHGRDRPGRHGRGRGLRHAA